MNSKKTNYLIAVMNVIAIVSFYLLYFSSNYLTDTMMISSNGAKNIYNNNIIEFLLLNIKPIMIILSLSIAIPNIVSAIQNKKDKKLSFWQLVFGVYNLSAAVDIAFLEYSDVKKWEHIIMFIVIPIILVIKNFITIKKDKPTKLKIVSYMLAIIIAIIEIFNCLFNFLGTGTLWSIIAIIMQFIYIHNQENTNVESKGRKVFNIILYYIIQTIVVVSFSFIVIYSLSVVKINEIKLDSQLSELHSNITKLQGITNEEIYIPVKKDNKYGFINEKGQEKIECQYNIVTYFYEIEINNTKYYIALANKDDKWYIISKSNESIELNGDVGKNIQTSYNYFSESVMRVKSEESRLLLYKLFLGILFRGNEELNEQFLEESDTNSITLTEQNSEYYYSNKNFTMIIEPLYAQTDYEENYYEESDDSSGKTKCNVTIIKPNGERKSSIVYLTQFDEYNATIKTFSNGYIEFENEEQTYTGWYDNNGNKSTISNDYYIIDIKDNKIILANYADGTSEYIIIDITGKVLLKTTDILIFNNLYAVKNENKNMILVDKDLNTISKEYDKILNIKFK